MASAVNAVKALMCGYAHWKEEGRLLAAVKHFINRTVIPPLLPYWWANHCFGY